MNFGFSETQDFDQLLNAFKILSMYIIISFQKLCDYVSELLLEESNVQPVSTPVTVCGDIHGQVVILWNIFWLTRNL